MESSSEDSDVEEAPGPQEAQGKVTPLEWDMQLQCAELVFRNLLEGKRVAIHPSEDPVLWQREALGEGWVQWNRRQRQQVHKQTKATGEGTPMWTEASVAMSDLAWELFEQGVSGERVRKVQEVARDEVLKLLASLHLKLEDSVYARFGAADRLSGFRAAVATLHLFADDAEVVVVCADCLRLIAANSEGSRDSLAEVTLPLPPAEFGPRTMDKGWSFLRHGLAAFLVQSGRAPLAPARSDGGAEERVVVSPQKNRQVALQVAGCLAACGRSQVLQVQLRLLREEVPEGACDDWRELKGFLLVALQAAQALQAEAPSDALVELCRLLRLAAPRGEGTTAGAS